MAREHVSPTFITGGMVLAPSGRIATGTVVVEDGRILEVSDRRAALPTDAKRIDARGRYVVPGFIDTHTHGFNGHDAMDGAAAVQGMSAELASHGVTGFFPTLIACPAGELRQTVRRAAPAETAGAAIYGVHVEGPYLDPAMPGMFDPRVFREFDRREVVDLKDAIGDLPVVMTVACQGERAVVAKALLAEGIIPSLGHCDGTYEDAVRAVESGVRRATHCFNAMTGFHHRDPGIIGGVLTRGEVRAELILDGLHVHPAAASLLLSLKGPEGVILVTDSTVLSGHADGRYEWSGYSIEISEGAARIPAGNLAGSLLSMDQAVRNAVKILGAPLEKAVEMASLTPARSAGIDRVTGSLAHGKNADIAILDTDLKPVMTLVKGEIAWRS
ncbi:MAG: N-acetylglucosamine-6-phosphate deacetylase [Chloroflexi bacterium]|nr:N-acetylglucosamine-6-phosphate deacetylase [Chloroflexota bacterium]MCY3938569.1 N-acetylglucosamine-6-phosphate deacetylase [Chloroflexota bacterium]